MNSLHLSDQEWKEKLTPEQYYVLREKGTEKPFTGKFLSTTEKGIYTCAGCGESLFTDQMKFESSCGWPSFDSEIAGGKITQNIDRSHEMVRTEIICAKCGGHLGHLFDDGPTQTGKRYCVNSIALAFKPTSSNTPNTISDSTHIITLAGGCFWCLEAAFQDLKGVLKVESGYSGGKTLNPTYKEVCTGHTGHAEVVQITYNPNAITIAQLLKIFFELHDPTTLNRQGDDVGTQYRSAIFYHTIEQKEAAEKIIALLTDQRIFKNPIVTEVNAFTHFYIAENYHQNYYELNKEEPYCKLVIRPKLDKFYTIFKNQLSDTTSH